MRAAFGDVDVSADILAARILVVAAEPEVRDAISARLVSYGFEVRQVEGGYAAVETLRKSTFSALVYAHDSRGMTAFELSAMASAIDPNIAFLRVASGEAADAGITRLGTLQAQAGLTIGSTDELLLALSQLLDQRTRAIERRRVDRAVRETVISRTVQIEKEKAALRKMSLDVVLALIRALELKDKYLAGHSERVSTLAGRTAEELKLSPALVEAIRLSGKLLDIGMIAIPDTILWKPGPLTPEEFDVVKTHVDLGLSILAPLDHLADVRTFVRDHHEHFDGGGYPRGLKGQGISIGGRILLAVDAYDSLLSPRPFRGALTSTEALSLLGRKAGRMIDPDVYLALSRVCGGRRNFTLI